MNHKTSPFHAVNSEKYQVESTLGTRKPEGLNWDTTHKSELAINLHSNYGKMNIEATCWLEDDKGRKVGFRLNKATLLGLKAQIDKELEEQKAFQEMYPEPTR